MIELYENEPEVIRKRFYRGGQTLDLEDLSYTIVDELGNVVDSGEAEESVETPGLFVATVAPLSSYEEEVHKSYKVIWVYGIAGDSVYEQTETIALVRPYARYEEIVSDHPQIAEQYTFDEIRNMERRVRMIIDTFCGQSFNYEPDKTITVAGTVGNSLALNHRIIRLTGMWANFGEITSFVSVSPGGTWMLRYNGPSGYVPYRDIKRDIGPGMGLEFMNQFFRGDTIYTVTGDFGWEEVPPMVNQAARLLVWDYFQPESEWRRKNMDNLRAADWRFEVATAPITTTGNIDADLMLSNYTAPGMAIL
jgi:hypothetical protein